jgi:hypothetical protein
LNEIPTALPAGEEFAAILAAGTNPTLQFFVFRFAKCATSKYSLLFLIFGVALK